MPTLYARNAAALKAASREIGAPCVHCAGEIDYTTSGAMSRTRLAFSADHIVPKSLGGTDAYTNLQPSHYGCNSRRGNGVTRGLGTRRITHYQPQRRSEPWP